SYKGDLSLKPIMRLDCSDAIVPFAFLLFAGIRPEELTKLEWSNVRLADRYIHVTPEAAKTNQVRHVVIMDNLAAFIKTIPAKKCTGKIVPSNWKRKSYLIRKMAGLQNRHDTARHSFASYFLALFPNVDKLRENMGHVRNSDMLFKHYRAAVSKQDAKTYFEIVPHQ
ncbi:MAG: tyrosine-type recombinase/integrase, partial [Akkermansia sp.]